MIEVRRRTQDFSSRWRENAKASGRREIRVDPSVRVDDERDARVRVGHEVARVPEARVEELLDEHFARNLARARLRSRLLTDRLGFLLQDLFAWTRLVIVRRDRGGYAFVDALALCLCLFE